jgi:tellurite resistance protein TehA-like permease
MRCVQCLDQLVTKGVIIIRRPLWILSGFWAFIFGAASIACAFQMIDKIENGVSYTINLYFHPVTGIISVVLLCVFLYPLVQKR